MTLVRFLAGLAAASFVVHAGFTPFYEVGMTRFFSPLFFFLYATVFLTFALQNNWARKWVLLTALIFPIINVVFPPTPEFFGAYTLFARVLVSVESVVCICIFFLIQCPRVKNWWVAR